MYTFKVIVFLHRWLEYLAGKAAVIHSNSATAALPYSIGSKASSTEVSIHADMYAHWKRSRSSPWITINF